ncbi:LOW QUALITY PROTEIN: hypothetical protein YC2023_081534 [Brassica napus]
MLKNDARDEAINRAKLESKIAQIILELAELKKLVDNNDARDEAINVAKLESKIVQIILELAELKKLVNG